MFASEESYSDFEAEKKSPPKRAFFGDRIPDDSRTMLLSALYRDVT